MLLSEKADIYRLLPDLTHAGRKVTRVWRRGVPCHLEPISAIDHTVAFALESTHVFYIPVWFLGLRKEDELRLSGRVALDGTRVAKRYVVKGLRRFPTFGLRHQAAYCQERE